MKIVVTDTGIIWHPLNPVLKECKESVLVVCIEGQKSLDEYEYFIIPHTNSGFCHSMGCKSFYYRDLEKVGDELADKLYGCEDILFLSDGSPESLYPYHIMRHKKGLGRLHLVASPPWKFEGKMRIKAHKELISDISELTSICYMDTSKCFNYENRSRPQTFERIIKDYSDLLPDIIKGIMNIKKFSCFDLKSRRYIPVKEGNHIMDLHIAKILYKLGAFD